MNITVDEHKQATHALLEGSTLEREGDKIKGEGGRERRREKGEREEGVSTYR